MKQMNSSHPPKEKNKRCVDTLVRLKILFTQRDMNTKNKVHVPKSTRYNYSFEYLMLVSSQAFFVVARHVTTTAVAIWLSLRMTFWEIQNFCARAKVGPRTSEEGIFIGCMSKELLDDADQLGTVWEVLLLITSLSSALSTLADTEGTCCSAQPTGTYSSCEMNGYIHPISLKPQIK